MALEPEPCVLLIFGATGDLAQRQLIPALFSLYRQGRLPGGFAVLGCARSPLDAEAYRKRMQAACTRSCRQAPTEGEWAEFSRRLYYESGHFTDLSLFQRLNFALTRIDNAHATRGNRLFYLATLPSQYALIVRQLKSAGMINAGAERPFTRLMIEKPFGRDLASAIALNEMLRSAFREEQIYRIDHYLGKETVQNILVFRFANAIFEPLWNRAHIDHVQITAAETIGIGHRGAYYEETGVLRDMVQNHLLQLLSLIAMEPPLSFEADAIRDKKVEVLKALHPLHGEEALRHSVRGQYGPDAEGKVAGYRGEPNVAPNSVVPTYVALKVFIDNWRWQGVPFYIRTGKRLRRHCTTVVVQFARVPFCLFGEARVCSDIEPNRLILRIEPDEGISLGFSLKTPGAETAIDNEYMDFWYRPVYGDHIPSAYERLLLDALRGYAALFARKDSVEDAWRFITPILEAWEASPPPAFPNYAAFTDGPAQADAWIRADGRSWFDLDLCRGKR